MRLLEARHKKTFKIRNGIGMRVNTDDTRIQALKELISPEALLEEIAIDETLAAHVSQARLGIHNILHGLDDRLVVVVGPCSIHDPAAAIDYGKRLAGCAEKYADTLMIVMRVYFEKPRTTVGWKGLINDPGLDGSFDINRGLRMARQLLVDLNRMGLPTGTEYLDLISPQYLADLVSWGAIGARTTESQTHRELASGLSCPVGFKNATDGDVQIAVDAIGAANGSHHFLSVTKEGRSAIFETRGNDDCHVILRGGKQPNYDMFAVDDACELLGAAGLRPQVMIDASHANSRKKPDKQIAVIADIAAQVSRGRKEIIGLMIESFIEAGRQGTDRLDSLVYGQSITDPCIAWDDTEQVLGALAESVEKRREAREAL
jgi:3-deoxy-7-phosphoheptulonate synthase